MTDQTPTNVPDAAPADEAVVNQNFLSKFAAKHPRTARALAITGVVVAVVSVATVSNTVRKNKEHLSNAAEEAQDAIRELSAAVSPDPETN
jgi:hypothetical protein